MPIQVQEASRTPNRLDQNRTTPWHIIIKTASTEYRERILRAVREKKTSNLQRWTHQNHGIFLNRNIKSKKRIGWGFPGIDENNFNPRILYPAKLSFKIDGAIKVFHDEQKLKQYMTTKPPLQKILQGILYTESESQHNHERTGSIKPQEKKRQENRKLHWLSYMQSDP
jgi:hypothetical protein